MPKTRALYGGSFDPPHFGHQMAIFYVLEGGYADEVRIIPCFEHPFGKRLSSFSDRVRYCEALIKPFGGRAVVDLIESDLAAPSFSYQTAEALAERFPEDQLRWIIGSDAAHELNRWKEIHRLEAAAPFLILGRQGAASVSDQTPLSLPEVASRDLRNRLADGENLQGWIPESVLALLKT
ncbi:MAG TPA: hypothetical protein DEB46_08025 [Myxococcales bacterium]|nr:hypothetical protein [Myxococcales bacterium]|tara:strand:- start:424 stop:963 length:540 start_codon:yes stop_codon:yes gene_type:complete